MELLVYALFLVAAVLIGRMLGAWMLRINEVIENQESQIQVMMAILNEIKNKEENE